MSVTRIDTDEKAIINSIITNPQGTHNQVVSNSVGMAVLMLKGIYWGVNPTEEFIAAEYEVCVGEMRALITDSNCPAIENMFDQAEEDIVPEYDTLTLFLPVAPELQPTLGQQEYEESKFLFPLKQVLPLAWRALHDHKKYVHHFSGTESEKLELATKDLKNRLESFFIALEKNRADRICHHGSRNDIIFVLNKSYQGIDLIEDARATVLMIIKDKILKLFWQEFKDIKISSRSVLMKA